MPLKRIQVGEPLSGIPANTWNALCDAAEQPRTGLRPVPLASPAPDESRIVHTGTAIDVAFGILFVKEPLNKPADRASAPYEHGHLVGEAPTTALIEAGGTWVILQEPAPANRAVPFVATGLSWVQIDVQDASDQKAGPTDGVTDYLTSGTGQAQIVWKESGTGLKWAVVQLGATRAAVATKVLATAAAAVDSTDPMFTVSIASLILLEGTAPEANFSASNDKFKFAIDSGGWVYCIQSVVDGEWHCIQAQCPVPEE